MKTQFRPEQRSKKEHSFDIIANPVKCQRQHLHSKLFEESTYSISVFGCAEKRSWYQKYGKGLERFDSNQNKFPKDNFNLKVYGMFTLL